MITYLSPFDFEQADKIDLLGDLAVHAPRHTRHYLEQEIEREYGLHNHAVA